MSNPFDDLFAGDANEDIRQAFADAEKDFEDAAKLAGDGSGAMVYPTDHNDTIGSTTPDGATEFAMGYREQPDGSLGYIYVEINGHEAWFPLNLARELSAWLKGRLDRAEERGAQ